MDELNEDRAKTDKISRREAELDQVLAALTCGVERLKKKTEEARKSEKFSRAQLEESPVSGFDVRRLKKTRMVFMAMAEESLVDSSDEQKLRPKKGQITKIETRPDPRPAPLAVTRPLPQPRAGS